MPVIKDRPECLKYHPEEIAKFGNAFKQLKEAIQILPRLRESAISISNPLADIHYVDTEATREQRKISLLEKIAASNKTTPLKNQVQYTLNKGTGTLMIQYQVVHAINFMTRKNDAKMATLLVVLWECIEEKGQVEGAYKQVAIPKRELLYRLQEKGVENVTENWLKNTKSNLLNKKIPSQLKDMIGFAYDQKLQLYLFKLKVTI